MFFILFRRIIICLGHVSCVVIFCTLDSDIVLATKVFSRSYCIIYIV